jgi:hypothetical protein
MIKEIGNFINKNKLLFFMIIAYLLLSASKETFKETFTSSGPQKTLSQRLEEINGYIANLESTIAQKTNDKNKKNEAISQANTNIVDAVKQRAMTQPWYDVIKDKPTQLYAKLVVFDSANTPGYEDHVKALKTANSTLSSEQEKKETAEQEKETLVNTISALNDKLTQYKSEKLNLEVLSCSKCQTVNEVSDADKKLCEKVNKLKKISSSAKSRRITILNGIITNKINVWRQTISSGSANNTQLKLQIFNFLKSNSEGLIKFINDNENEIDDYTLNETKEHLMDLLELERSEDAELSKMIELLENAVVKLQEFYGYSCPESDESRCASCTNVEKSLRVRKNCEIAKKIASVSSKSSKITEITGYITNLQGYVSSLNSGGSNLSAVKTNIENLQKNIIEFIDNEKENIDVYNMNSIRSLVINLYLKNFQLNKNDMIENVNELIGISNKLKSFYNFSCLTADSILQL